jgi:hypothetical protein
MDDVLNWFNKTGFEFVNSIPKINADKESMEEKQLFVRSSEGTTLNRLFTQLNLLITGGKEGLSNNSVTYTIKWN